MTHEEMINQVQGKIISHGIPFLPASMVRVNGNDDYEMLRNAKRAVDDLVKNYETLSRKYPYEFRSTLVSLSSIVNAELQSFDATQRRETK